MSDLSVRVATPNDVHVWRALRMEGITSNPSVFVVTADEAAAVPIEEDIKRLRKADRVLALMSETPIGLAGFNQNSIPRANHRAEAGPFYVIPVARGQGVADKIMGMLIDAARSVKVWQLELFVNVENHRAIAFYHRHGFSKIGKIPNSILGADGMENDFLMIRTERPAE